MSVQPTNSLTTAQGSDPQLVLQLASLPIQSAAASQQELTRMLETFQKAMQDMRELIQAQTTEIATLKASLLQMQTSSAESSALQARTNATVSQSIAAVQNALNALQQTQNAQATQNTQVSQSIASCNTILTAVGQRLAACETNLAGLQSRYSGHTHGITSAPPSNNSWHSHSVSGPNR